MKHVKFAFVGLTLCALASAPALAADSRATSADGDIPVFQLPTVVVIPTAAQLAQLKSLHANTAPQHRLVDNNRHDTEAPGTGCLRARAAHADSTPCHP